jgi:hypothetical protein
MCVRERSIDIDTYRHTEKLREELTGAGDRRLHVTMRAP